ncbi:MAG: hypothetical protein H5T69_12640, partial [Chloroflexi bacterium]|nr:hypothetical protein [Chloroflexota bacterium]
MIKHIKAHACRILATLRCEQRGDMLPFAMIAMVTGILLMAPLLSQVSSGQKTVVAAYTSMRDHYASDAGAEWGIYKLATDEALAQTLIETLGTPQTLALTSPVNGEMPLIKVVAVSTWSDGSPGEGDGPGSGGQMVPLEWVVWANSDHINDTIKFSGSGHVVNGNIHSNHEIRLTGSGHTITGRVRYVDQYSAVGSGHNVPGPFEDIEEPLEMPAYWNIEDFRPGGAYAQQAAAEGRYYQHSTLSISGSGTVIPEGLYYCTGLVSISGSGIVAHHVTIVSENRIHLSGSVHDFTPYVAGLTFFSNSDNHSVGAIKISGSGNTGGACYAPRGKIDLSGSGGTIYGGFIGDEVTVTGSGAQINPVEGLLVPAPPGQGGGDGGGEGEA